MSVVFDRLKAHKLNVAFKPSAEFTFGKLSDFSSNEMNVNTGVCHQLYYRNSSAN